MRPVLAPQWKKSWQAIALGLLLGGGGMFGAYLAISLHDYSTFLASMMSLVGSAFLLLYAFYFDVRMAKRK